MKRKQIVFKKRVPKKQKNIILKGLFTVDYLELYSTSFVISINQSDEELRECLFETLRNKDGSDIAENYLNERMNDLKRKSPSHQGICVSCEGIYYIRLYEEVNTIYQHGYLAHEIGHAVFFCLRDRGMVFSEDSEEAYTYLIGYITSKAYSLLIK